MIDTYPPVLYPVGGLTTQTSFALSGGETPLSAWPAGLVVIPTGMAVSAAIRFVGTGLENRTGTCRVYLGEQDAENGLCLPTYRGSAALTLGTTTVSVSGVSMAAPVSAKFVDTIGWTPATTATTPKGSSVELLAHFANDLPDQYYSPADNTAAQLFIGLYGRRLLLLDFDNIDADSFGALVTLYGAG